MCYTMLMLVPAALLVAADDQADKDKKALQGTWQVTSFESKGEAVSEDEVKNMKLVFKDDTFSMSDGKKTEGGKFKLDATKKPKALDATLDKTSDKVLFIYEIDGDTLKLCWNKPGSDERPKEFTGKGGVGYMVLKREK